MSDKNYLDMDSTAFAEYIKKCPQKYVHELPKKLEEWSRHQMMKNALERMKNTAPIIMPATEGSPNFRLELIKDIIVRHAPHTVSSAEMLVDYAIEVADKLMDRLKAEG